LLNENYGHKCVLFEILIKTDQARFLSININRYIYQLSIHWFEV